MEEIKNTETVAENVTENNSTEKMFTQEQVNEIIKKKLEKVDKKYEGYMSKDDFDLKAKEIKENFEQQITDLGNSLNVANEKAETDAQTIADLQARVKTHETDSVKIRTALEFGIPYELANKLSGETEEDIRKDAQNLSAFIQKPNTVAPLRNAEAGEEMDGVTKRFLELNPGMKL